ncbi:hypothetical protein CISECK367B_23720 [Citrobacter sedlakii]
MAGGDFNATVNAEVEGGEIDLFGAGKADIQHIDARVLQPLRQRQLQRLTGQTHVAAEYNGFRFEKFAIGAANPPRNIFV